MAMTAAGIKRSNTFRNNNGTLYIFEHKNGTRVCCDALNQFARAVGVHASNLWHTFKCYNGRKWTGNWRIVKIFDLSRPDWKSISMWIKNCKMSKRITEKIHAVKRNLLSLIRSYRRTFINIFTENTEQACNASVVTTNSHLDELKENFKDYYYEKADEKTSVGQVLYFGTYERETSLRDPVAEGFASSNYELSY